MDTTSLLPLPKVIVSYLLRTVAFAIAQGDCVVAAAAAYKALTGTKLEAWVQRARFRSQRDEVPLRRLSRVSLLARRLPTQAEFDSCIGPPSKSRVVLGYLSRRSESPQGDKLTARQVLGEVRSRRCLLSQSHT
jgi:hypothetical protein